MQIRCAPVQTDAEMAACLAIRHRVFTEEQNVPQETEMDGHDATAQQYCVRCDDVIIGTCRVRLSGSAAKIERVAVLGEYRSKGVGGVLMKYILHELGKTGDIQLFKLSAQAHTVPFYEKLGFKTRGSEYITADIPHYDMILEKE